jgi:hypothetical protein
LGLERLCLRKNIADKEYIGSVRVNDDNLRFFEPAADRNYLLGFKCKLQVLNNYFSNKSQLKKAGFFTTISI